MAKDFISIADFSREQLGGLLERAVADKALFRKGKLSPTLREKTLAMIFEKPSLRTRISFEVAMTHLGGHAIYLTQADIGLGSREPVQDIARVIGRMCNGIMARTFSHQFVELLAKHSPVPVINGLTDYSHPCQAMADLMTVLEHFGRGKRSAAALAGKTLAFVGDGNNVARSLSLACAKLGMRFILAAPKGYQLEEAFVQRVLAVAPDAFRNCENPVEAVTHADVIYTDTWISMGQEKEKEKRVRDFAGFQVNAELLAKAPSHAIVLHCLPAYRGFEISDEAFEAHAATILDEAENRLHFQRTLLNVLISEGGIE
jgi:ornithine carbamoyltransferase